MDGKPPHAPLQQSPFELQSLPAPRHGAVHTGIPCESATQMPRQQSESMTQGLDVSRQLTPPTSQRPVAPLHTVEQHPPPPPPASVLHASPLGKHACAAAAQRPESHRPEQQPESSTHGPPTTLQMAPPHWPALQPSEQQSCASSHCAPLLSQNAPHEVPPCGPGAQRPLQHDAPYSHAAPGGEHVPEGRQYESSQRAEQQSPGPLQYCPLERQVGPASLIVEQGAASSAGALTASLAVASGADASRAAASTAGPLPRSTSSPQAAATAATTNTAIAEASGRDAI